MSSPPAAEEHHQPANLVEYKADAAAAAPPPISTTSQDNARPPAAGNDSKVEESDLSPSKRDVKGQEEKEPASEIKATESEVAASATPAQLEPEATPAAAAVEPSSQQEEPTSSDVAVRSIQDEEVPERSPQPTTADGKAAPASALPAPASDTPAHPVEELTESMGAAGIDEGKTAGNAKAAEEAVVEAKKPEQTQPAEEDQQAEASSTDVASESTSQSAAAAESASTQPASSEEPAAPTISKEEPVSSDSMVRSPPLPSKQQSLPPPPLPSKPAAPADSPQEDEKEAVARAFGVTSTPQPSTPAHGTPNIAITASPAAERSLASPATPSTTSGSIKSPGIRIGKGPPPTTLPAEEAPFDFNRFLEQMKDPSAKGVGEYVRSFIKGFAKKPYRTSDQIKLIFDFLDFISARMRGCAVWAQLSESDFENAKEAMEKLVMNRLYSFTFTPAVAKEGRWSPQTDDLERDRVLRERIELFSWLQEEHLDVPKGDHSRGFVDFAIQELLKINHYKAPRDKLICILNCCKVIFGLIRHLGSDENADTFVPVLIFVVLKANPEHLISNVEYIGRFRNPDKLSSESGYYLSSLMGATAFIETMDYSSLSNITQEEFEKNVEEAVAKVGSRSPAPTGASSLPSGSNVNLTAPLPRTPMHQRTASASADPHAPLTSGEEAASHLPTSPPLPPPPPLPVTGALNFADDTKAFLQRTGEAARVGFTNSLGKPIGALGKLLGEGLEGIRTPGGGSGSTSTGASPARVGSPSHVEQQLQQQQQQGASGSGSATARSGIWGGLFGAEDPNDTNVPPPQTPAPGQQRQGPFSSLMRGGGAAPTDPAAYSSGSTSNVAPQRRIGETPYAPPRQKPAHILTGGGGQQQGGRPAPIRQESVDPFNSPDPATTTTPGMGTSKGGGRGGAGASAAQSGRFAGPAPTTSRLQSRGYEGYGYEDEDDDHDTGRGGRGGGGSIGTPSDLDSDEEDERRVAAAGGAGGARSRLPDLGAFVPSFLTQQPQQHQSQSQQGSRASGQQHYLTRGPNRGQPAFPSSSVGQPSSDDPDLSISSTQGGEDMSALSAEVDRRHREQVEASVETLKSVFPQMDEEVRRAVLEEAGGDVGVAIDRLLEMQGDD